MATESTQPTKSQIVPWNQIGSLPAYKSASLEQKREVFKNWYKSTAQRIAVDGEVPEEKAKALNRAADAIRSQEDLGATLWETIGDLAYEVGFPVVVGGAAMIPAVASAGVTTPVALAAAGVAGTAGNLAAQRRRIERGEQFGVRGGEAAFQGLANTIPLGRLGGGVVSRLAKETVRQGVIGGAADVGAQIVDTGEVDPQRALLATGITGIAGAGFELPFALFDKRRAVQKALLDKNWEARVEGRMTAPIGELLSIAQRNPDELAPHEAEAVMDYIETAKAARAEGVYGEAQGISQEQALAGIGDPIPVADGPSPVDSFIAQNRQPTAMPSLATQSDGILGQDLSMEGVNAAVNQAAGVTPVAQDGPVGQQVADSPEGAVGQQVATVAEPAPSIFGRTDGPVEDVPPTAYGKVENIDGEFVVYNEDGDVIDVAMDDRTANQILTDYRASLVGEDLPTSRAPLAPDDDISLDVDDSSPAAVARRIETISGAARPEAGKATGDITMVVDDVTGDASEAFTPRSLERIAKRLRAIESEVGNLLKPSKGRASPHPLRMAKADKLTLESLELRARVGDEQALTALNNYRAAQLAYEQSDKPNTAVLSVLNRMKWDGPVPEELVNIGVPAKWGMDRNRASARRLTADGKLIPEPARLANAEGAVIDGDAPKFDEVLHEFQEKLEQAGYISPSAVEGADTSTQVQEAMDLIARAISEGPERPPAVPSIPFTPADEARILAPFDEVADRAGRPIKRPSRRTHDDDLPPLPEDGIFADLDGGENIAPKSGRKMREAIQDSLYASGKELEPRIIRTRDRLANALTEKRPEVKEQKLERLLYDLEANAVAKERLSPDDRVRGADFMRERILNAKRNGEISEDAADFAEWILTKNPGIADDLGISFRTPRESGISGTYNPFNRVVTLFKNGENWTTAVHEILHHAEQLMPQNIREGIRRSWSKALAKRIATEKDAVKRSLFEKMALAEAGDMKAAKEIDDAFQKKVLSYEDYHLANPSEYWAVKATAMARSKFEDDGLWARAGRFVKDMIEYMKEALGVNADASVIRALNRVLDGSYKGKPEARAMISNRIKYFADVAKKTPDEAKRALINAVRENDDIVRQALKGTPYEGVSGAVAKAIAQGPAPDFDPKATIDRLEKMALDARKGSQQGLKAKIIEGIQFMEDKFLTQHAYIVRLTNRIEKMTGKKFRPADDPRLLYTTRGMNHQSIANEYLDQSGAIDFMKGLRAKAKAAGEKTTDYVASLDQYLIAKQALQRYALGATEDQVGGGMTKEIAENLVASLAKKHEAEARFINSVYKDLLDKAVDGGLVSKDLADELKRMFPDYVPFHRIFDEDEIAEGVSSYVKGKAVGSIGSSDLVQRFVGSQRMIESPMEEMFKKAYSTIAQVERNRVARAIASLGDNAIGEAAGIRALYRINADGSPLAADGAAVKLDDGGYMLMGADGKPVKDQYGKEVILSKKYVEKGEDGKFYGNGKFIETGDVSKAKHKISFMENGQKLMVEVPKRVEEVAKGLNVPDMGLFFNVFNIPVRLARAGFTSLNIIFGLRQLPRDLNQVIANTTNFKDVPKVVGAFGDGIKSAFGQRMGVDTPLFNRWGEFGGRFNFADMMRSSKEGRATVSRLIGNIPITKRPMQALQKVEDFISAFEDMTRLATFKAETDKAANAAIAAGADIRFDKDNYLVGDQAILEDIFTKAAFESQERTANYLNRGEWGRALNGVFLYLNAGLQGTRANVKAFRANPTAYLIKTAMMGGAGLATVTAYNLATPERAEAYMNLTEDDRERNLIVLHPMGLKDEQGNYIAIRMPLPQGISGLLQTPRRAVEQAYGFSVREGDPGMFTSFLKDVFGFVTPFEPEGDKMLSTIVPQAVRPALEVGVVNRSLFTGQAIVPKYLEDTIPEDQYTSKTSATARAIGKVMGVSPIKIEALSRGYAGSLAQTAFWASDKVVGPLTGVEPRGQSIPDQIAASFFRARGGEQMNRFYDNLGDADEIYRSIRVAADRGDPERARSIANENRDVLATYKMLRANSAKMSKIYSSIRTLEARQDENPELKKDVVKLRAALVEIARASNEAVDKIRGEEE